MALSSLVAEFKHDELIGGTYPPLITANVTFARVSKTLLRGTLVAKNADGKYVAEDSTQTDSQKVGVAVLAEDLVIDAEDTVGIVYTSGMFNRNRIILVQESDNIDNHEDELRSMGIYLTAIQGDEAVAEAESMAAITGEVKVGETVVGEK